MQGDHVQQFVGEVTTDLRHTATETIVREHGVSQVISLYTLTKKLAVGGDATDGNAAEIDAVVALHATDKAGFCGLPLQSPVGSGHFQGGICRLGARVGKENIIEISGHEFLHPVGQFESLWVAELERWCKIQFPDLLCNRLADFLTPVTETGGPQTRVAVENLSPSIIGIPDPPGRHDDAWVFLELPVARVGHPMGFQRVPVHSLHTTLIQ